MMKPISHHAGGSLTFETHEAGFTNISRAISSWLDEHGASDGLLNVFIAHTSASLTIQENADPDVLSDLSDALERIAPRGHAYRHSSEGPDDMPSHIKSMVTSTNLSIPVEQGRMALGIWQGIYLIEHRDAPHQRKINLTFLGSARGD